MGRLFLLCILGLFIIGCAATKMYKGEKLPDEEIAIIEGMSPINPLNIGVASQVKKVDGVEVPDSGTKISVSTGNHELEVYCSMSGYSSTTNINIDAKAGKRYILPVGVSNGECVVMILE